jgi:drug/metabolite transporter (DMT)-like permease
VTTRSTPPGDEHTSSRLTPFAAHVRLQATVLLWGMTALLGKSIGVGARVLVFYRVLIVAGVMLALLVKKRIPLAVPWRTRLELVATGALVAIHWMAFYGTIKLGGIAVAVTSLSTTTFFTALLEPLVFGRRVRPRELLVGALVVVAVAVLLGVELGSPRAAIALGLVSAFFSAAFGTWNGRLSKMMPAEKVTFYELSSALVVTGATFLVKGPFVPPWALSAADAARLAFLAVFCTALPWLWSLRVLRTLSPYTVALSIALEPVYSLALAALVFPSEERLGPRFYAGASLAFALVVLDAWGKRRRPEPTGDAPPGG